MFTSTSHTVIDMHSDIATDIAVRRAAGERQVFQRYHFEKLKKAGVYGVFSVLWVEPEYRHQSTYRLLQLLGSLLADIQECRDYVEIVTTESALTEVMNTGKIGLVLGVEGMTFVEQWPIFEQSQDRDLDETSLPLSHVSMLQEQMRQSLAVLGPLGLKHAILVWGEDNEIASGPIPGHSPSTNRGLTAFGHQVVQHLQSQKILVDLSHLDDASTDAVLTSTSGVVLASHSNARALCNVPRNLTDSHIDEIGRRAGVIGINAYPEFIHESDASLDKFIDHIVYIANRIGIQHVGLGFDFTDFLHMESDGWNRAGIGLRSVKDVPVLVQRMHERGFADSEIQGVTYKNALRIFGSQS